jgi:hypothetical protein
MVKVAPSVHYEVFTYAAPDCESVDLAAFCASVAGRCSSLGAQVVEGQIRESLGGISNLYVACLLRLAQPEMQTATERALVSDSVPAKAVVREIQHCAGVDPGRAQLILRAIAYCIGAEFRGRSKNVLYLPTLGKLEPVDLDAARYRFTFRDPACEHYGEYLQP